MGFLIAAYALALGALLAYGLHLARERRRLLGELEHAPAEIAVDKSASGEV